MDATAIVTLVFGCLAVLAGWGGTLWYFAVRTAHLDHLVLSFAKLEAKVQTIYEFLARRAMSEALLRGAVKKNSPLAMTAEGRDWFSAALTEALHQFWAEAGNQLPESDLFLEIEKRFGERLLSEVCIPKGLTAGACIIAAIQMMREPTKPPPLPSVPQPPSENCT